MATLLAFNLGTFLELSLRWVIFLVSVLVGGILLISINISGQDKPRTLRQLSAGTKILLSAKASTPSLPIKSPKDTTSPLPSTPPQMPPTPSTTLTPTQARAWLDDFLVEQQRRD